MSDDWRDKFTKGDLVLLKKPHVWAGEKARVDRVDVFRGVQCVVVEVLGTNGTYAGVTAESQLEAIAEPEPSS